MQTRWKHTKIKMWTRKINIKILNRCRAKMHCTSYLSELVNWLHGCKSRDQFSITFRGSYDHFKYIFSILISKSSYFSGPGFKSHLVITIHRKLSIYSFIYPHIFSLICLEVLVSWLLFAIFLAILALRTYIPKIVFWQYFVRNIQCCFLLRRWCIRIQ